MQQEFWHNCWQNNSTGWHQDDYHPLLTEYFESLSEPSDKRIFVPLCGKSSDLLFFIPQYQVVGNELSHVACEQFFTDNKLPYQCRKDSHFKVFESTHIDIFQGDFFALNAASFAPFDWLYDRAALIALPESMQQQYVDKLSEFFTGGTRLLLLTLDYPQSEMTGPPFAINEHRVRQLFQGFNISKLTERELVDGRFAQRQFPVSQLMESLYVITRD